MIATLMAWLNDVGAGGGTAYHFPNREMLVKPEKGAAAFWMNLKSDGRLERQSMHGGCPVLMGSKWILNKWMYQFDQWRKYPCLLEKDQFLPPFKGVTH